MSNTLSLFVLTCPLTATHVCQLTISGKDLHKIFITVYPQPASKTYPKNYISALRVHGMMLHFDIFIFWFTRKENSEILINFRSAPSLRCKETMPAFGDKS